MQPITLLSDQLEDSFQWTTDLAAFFHRPEILVAVCALGLAASLRLTRSPRHTVAGAAMATGSFALPVLAALVASPLGWMLLPLAAAGLFQASHWGGARRDRLRWIWQILPSDDFMRLVVGTVLATAALVILWGSTVLAVSNGNPDGMLLHSPSSAAIAWALFGMAGALASVTMLIAGGAAMVQSWRLIIRDAITPEHQVTGATPV